MNNTCQNSNPYKSYLRECVNTLNANSVLRDSFAGGISGILAFSMTCPLEVIQTRLQSTVDRERIKLLKPFQIRIPLTNYLPKPISVEFRTKYLTIARDILKNDGFFGFYKGYLPLIIGIIPSRSIAFSANMSSRTFLKEHLGVENEKFIIGSSAAIGSLAASNLTCPIWVTKTHLQLKRHSLHQKVSLISVIKEIYKNNGISGFYRGLSSSYYGSMETMFYWVMYETIKKSIQDYYCNTEREISVSESTKASVLAKTLALIVGYPHEVARTRMRQGLRYPETGKLIYREFWSTLYKISKEEGFQRIYAGLPVQLLRQVPNAVIMMVTFENIRHFIVNVNN